MTTSTKGAIFATKAQVEQLIAKYSVTGLLQFISEVCREKADHIKETYQDKELAKQWENAGHQITNTSKRIKV